MQKLEGLNLRSLNSFLDNKDRLKLCISKIGHLLFQDMVRPKALSSKIDRNNARGNSTRTLCERFDTRLSLLLSDHIKGARELKNVKSKDNVYIDQFYIDTFNAVPITFTTDNQMDAESKIPEGDLFTKKNVKYLKAVHVTDQFWLGSQYHDTLKNK